MTAEPTAALTIRETVSLAVSVNEALAEWKEYQDLTHQLLDDSDYQSIGKKKFKKKSAWRKYARAFNISDRVTYEEIIREEDGFPIYARIRVEARHTNGRTSEADHECHISERCCPAAHGLPCDKSSWNSHSCCARGCVGRQHWSHPGDIPATATTRAKNRAISDLIGAGEVSAEEMDGQRHAGVIDGEARDLGPAEGSNGSGESPIHTNGGATIRNPSEPATDQQKRALFAVGSNLGWDSDRTKREVVDFCGSEIDELTKGQASRTIDQFNAVYKARR